MNQVPDNDNFWQEKAQAEFKLRAVAEATLGMVEHHLEHSTQKIKAGLRHAASGEHQDYPPGTLELGVAMDAIAMLVKDIQRALASHRKAKADLTKQKE